ncbi:NADH-quinone oxidoreductase subunit J family protein [Marinigracilibium pacificum]|uniref:NADH-quinone oxidoreductase subunit J n=1 Tax=Marinigracilibium pacificum TaxID=2729599 RepID=A0A848J0U3_9BACT|nr:NADH-quinone oxidoreductase subunit J [Marinigracilibium pacificum]NMM48978.1 NADH-quinone oxidoreductase subunit J [Marinigracilibium pacificum]
MPDIGTISVYSFAVITVIGAFFVLITRHILYAAFGLLVCLLGVAGLYLLAGAEFLGVTQLLVYAGGILVLIIFGIMLTNRMDGKTIKTGNHRVFPGIVAGLALFLLFIQIYSQSSFRDSLRNAGNNIPSAGHPVEQLGIETMTRYLLPFELIAVILLVILVGSLFISKKEDDAD